MEVLIGVDGGGSKTHCLAARSDGVVVGFGMAGSGNYESVGMDSAMRNIRASVEQALASRSAEAEVAFGCFSLSGADFEPEDFYMFATTIKGLGIVGEFSVKNDMFGCLRAGTSRPYGVVVNMGSGFNGAGIGKNGSEFRFISKGYRYGDICGGSAIADDILFHSFRSWDGRGRPTILLDKVLAYFDVTSAEELARYLYYGEDADGRIIGLSPLAFEAAEEGDEVARDIIRKFAEEAGAAACAIIRHVGLQDEEFEVVLAGSVFKGRGSRMIDATTDVVRKAAPRARIVLPRFEPVVGALMLALEQTGVKLQDDVLCALEASVPAELRSATTQ